MNSEEPIQVKQLLVVTEPFRTADAYAMRKIDEVEAVIKGRCEDELRMYFDEMCAVFHVDFISPGCMLLILRESARRGTCK